ncbi:hypothetical protein DEALK_06770 [Dehalogenimonas alkenigignens]|uniref:Uncharacterized protein n=1 Tax=Dehalogenimonas alkenigignens TaxID=1217799 RepID=A0A0W0GGZ0_9CHLR|nr:hypothetical protein [Dehalogenimonas alkenigignens]KTB47832.1 hypothetical protein DEALK_06770 [Dehalogenimonas alkenigignens]
MEDGFEDEMLAFMMKAIIVSGCVFALWPVLSKSFSASRAETPLSGRLYLDPDTGNYWVYVPEEEKS